MVTDVPSDVIVWRRFAGAVNSTKLVATFENNRDNRSKLFSRFMVYCFNSVKIHGVWRQRRNPCGIMLMSSVFATISAKSGKSTPFSVSKSAKLSVCRIVIAPDLIGSFCTLDLITDDCRTAGIARGRPCQADACCR